MSSMFDPSIVTAKRIILFRVCASNQRGSFFRFCFPALIFAFNACLIINDKRLIRELKQ